MPSDNEDQDVDWDNLKTITTFDSCEFCFSQMKFISRSFSAKTSGNNSGMNEFHCRDAHPQQHLT